jgi:hypothetical protein
MKMLPLVAELFRADRQTDMTKITVAFYNFGKVYKKKMWQHFKIPKGRPVTLTATVS